jgi:uncharacterized protein YjbI with pentapeptide repeats
MSRKRKREEAEADKAAAAIFLDMLRGPDGEINVDLSKANLEGADLSGANLKGADLRTIASNRLIP